MIYISRMGEEYGPYPIKAARAYFQTGNIRPDDLVRSESQSEWTRAENHPLLRDPQLAPPPSQSLLTEKTPSESCRSTKRVGGWLLLLCVLLTIANPIEMFLEVFGAWKYFPKGPKVFSILYCFTATYGILVGLRLWRRGSGAVSAAKGYLVFLGFVPLIALLAVAWDRPQNQFADANALDLNTVLFADMMKAVAPNIIWSIVWYQYLARSRRVNETFSDAEQTEDFTPQAPVDVSSGTAEEKEVYGLSEAE